MWRYLLIFSGLTAMTGTMLLPFPSDDSSILYMPSLTCLKTALMRLGQYLIRQTNFFARLTVKGRVGVWEAVLQYWTALRTYVSFTLLLSN